MAAGRPQLPAGRRTGRLKEGRGGPDAPLSGHGGGAPEDRPAPVRLQPTGIFLLLFSTFYYSSDAALFFFFFISFCILDTTFCDIL